MSRSFTLKGFFVVASLTAGVLLRIWFSHIADPMLRWDSAWYFTAGSQIAHGSFIPDCCYHGIGYPLFLGMIFKFFGETLVIVQIFQIALDVGVAFLLYGIATRIQRQAREIIFIVYLLNPFTSAFTGIIMTEILSIFLIALLVYLFTSIGSAHRAFVFGIVLGFLVATKPVFVWFAPFCFLLPFCLAISWKKKWLIEILSIVGFVLVSSLSLLVNFQHFHAFSLVPPRASTGIGLYQNLFSGRTAELLTDFVPENPDWLRVNQHYYWLIDNNYWDELPVSDAKYRGLFFQAVAKDPGKVLGVLVQNFFWMWDKRHLFIYTDPFYPNDTVPLRVLNIVIFVFAFVGILGYIRKTSWRQPVVLFSGALFLYMSLVFPLVSNLTRHSLPFYPVLLFWVGNGVRILKD